MNPERELARAVILRGVADVLHKDADIRRSAWGFIHGIGDDNTAVRRHWVYLSGWGDEILSLMDRLNPKMVEGVKASDPHIAHNGAERLLRASAKDGRG